MAGKPEITKLGCVSVLSFGGGVNSTAILAGIIEKGISPPDLILFADTGNEFEDTYRHVEEVSAWCESEFQRRIVRVHRDYERHVTLEHECWNLKTLPSKAFGYGGCSVKWKRQPLDRYVRNWQPAKDAWARGESVQRWIGIDAGEQHRGKLSGDPRFEFRFPLIEWGWDRAECERAIERAGLTIPRKSACFFCPAARKHEVVSLSKERPDMFARAVALERQARAAGSLQKVKGLGRGWSWEEVAASHSAFEAACNVVDGDCVECHD